MSSFSSGDVVHVVTRKMPDQSRESSGSVHIERRASKMNCEKCGSKIMASVARQQEGGENLCRGCYLDKIAKEQEVSE